MNNDAFKGMFQSKTVLAAGVAVAAGALGVFGYSISATDQASIVELVSAVGALVGGVGAICGRVVATKKIGQ